MIRSGSQLVSEPCSRPVLESPGAMQGWPGQLPGVEVKAFKADSGRGGSWGLWRSAAESVEVCGKEMMSRACRCEKEASFWIAAEHCRKTGNQDE